MLTIMNTKFMIGKIKKFKYKNKAAAVHYNDIPLAAFINLNIIV